MRFLCLHGVGSSGSICESQFGPILKAVDPSYEFVFVDGPVQCDRGPGMGAYLEGPFFSHTASYTPDTMAEALDHLDATIDELGPFDGVLGFSQGAALALSFLHRQQLRQEPLSFRFALCFSSVIPCSADPSYCQGVIQRLCSRQRDVFANNDDVDEEDSLLTADDRLFREVLERTVLPAHENNALMPDYDMGVYADGSDGSQAPRVMHPRLQKERIRIPTVHVVGKRDFYFMRNMSEAASGICEERLMKKLEHSGGHQAPQKDTEVKAIVRAVEWVISQSERATNLRM